jgi:hypothetical protein
VDTSSEVAAILSLAGVLITGLLTTLTAIRSGKDRRERNADRRKIEEETTDVILKRVRAELDRAYEAIDIKDLALRKYANFFRVNERRLYEIGLQVPEVDTDEGPRMREDMHRFRVELDQSTEDESETSGGC